ncbi:hypothetical protein GCM10007036_31340 [Alsobacter metallidurans]|uniref:Uncharacterized protein n=1 Tax=Alsobacter metallidurans TaxID=340221 RepID=A0A917I9Z3_9HYPH|nr:hypothetical protein GCM10007036_31340 [Alsobacter metallidurans]
MSAGLEQMPAQIASRAGLSWHRMCPAQRDTTAGGLPQWAVNMLLSLGCAFSMAAWLGFLAWSCWRVLLV